MELLDMGLECLVGEEMPPLAPLQHGYMYNSTHIGLVGLSTDPRHGVSPLVAVLVSAAVPAQLRVREVWVPAEAEQAPEAAGLGHLAHAAGEEAVRGDQLVRVPLRGPALHHRHPPAAGGNQ